MHGFSGVEPILVQTCKIFQTSLNRIIGSLSDEGAQLELQIKLKGRRDEFRPMFESKAPPNLKDLLYEVLSALRNDAGLYPLPPQAHPDPPTRIARCTVCFHVIGDLETAHDD